MISKNGILEIFDKHLNYKDLFGKSLIEKIYSKRKITNLKFDANCIEDIKIELKNKKLFIIVHGEEIYVKFMTLPKVTKEKMEFVIREELRYRFKNLDNIMFTYEIFKDNGKSLDVVVFCLNWSKSDLIRKCAQRGGEIKGIYPIQFCVFNKYKHEIKEKKFIFIFLLDSNIYLLGCSNDKIIGNTVIKAFNEEKFEDELGKFIIKCNLIREVEYVPNILFLNFSYKQLIDLLSKTYKCRDLGKIDNEDRMEIFKGLI